MRKILPLNNDDLSELHVAFHLSSELCASQSQAERTAGKLQSQSSPFRARLRLALQLFHLFDGELTPKESSNIRTNTAILCFDTSFKSARFFKLWKLIFSLLLRLGIQWRYKCWKCELVTVFIWWHETHFHPVFVPCFLITSAQWNIRGLYRTNQRYSWQWFSTSWTNFKEFSHDFIMWRTQRADSWIHPDVCKQYAAFLQPFNSNSNPVVDFLTSAENHAYI